MQESLIALKTILKEIDPFAFEEALRLNASQKKIYAVKQDEEDRKNLDKKWDKLNMKLKSTDPHFQEPDCKCLMEDSCCRPVQAEPVDKGLQRALHEDLRQGKVHEPMRRPSSILLTQICLFYRILIPALSFKFKQDVLFLSFGPLSSYFNFIIIPIIIVNKMERAAAEANIALMSKMLSICREKTLKKNHSSDQLSADEKKQF